MAELDERVGDLLDEAGRPADEHVRALGRRGADRLEHLAVHAPVLAVPAVGALAGERAVHRQARARGQVSSSAR